MRVCAERSRGIVSRTFSGRRLFHRREPSIRLAILLRRILSTTRSPRALISGEFTRYRDNSLADESQTFEEKGRGKGCRGRERRASEQTLLLAHARFCSIFSSRSIVARAPKLPAVDTVLGLAVAKLPRCARTLSSIHERPPPSHRSPSSRDQQLFQEASELPIIIWVMGTAQNGPLPRRDRVVRRKCVDCNAILTACQSMRDVASSRRTCRNSQYEIRYARLPFVAYLSVSLTGRYPERATRGLANDIRSSIYSDSCASTNGVVECARREDSYES